MELPCGSVLTVEPADMDYKKKQQVIQSKESEVIEKVLKNDEEDIVQSSELVDEEDDLDDFFQSL